jgi:hypothetical protein
LLGSLLKRLPLPAYRNTLSWIGGALGIAGAVFVGHKLWKQSGHIAEIQIDEQFLLLIALLSLIYGLTNFLLARAWWLLLKCFNDVTAWKWAVKTYGISQLAKYVPGNVFQFAGRQALGVAEGLSGKSMAKSAVVEIALLAISGATLASLTLSLVYAGLQNFIGPLVSFSLAVMVIIAIYAWRGWLLVHAYLLQLLFFVSAGIIFVLTLNAIHPGLIGVSEAPIVTGAFVLSWLIGFLTPGAPAGIGIRELVLTIVLNNMIGATDLILAVALSRLITMLGDLGFFFVTALGINGRRSK